LLRALPIGSVLITGCSAQPAAPAAPPAPPYTPTATMKEIMQLIIDPAADDVWQAVMTVDSQQGTTETVPRSDEDWLKARRGALTLIEASNLLMTPGRKVGHPHDKSEVPGVELEPAEMEANINQDLPEFHKAALRLHDAGMQALAAIDGKDAPRLFEVGETIEMACEHCHSRYWYPNEKIPTFPDTPAQQEPPAK
jgi:hypothetical protein